MARLKFRRGGVVDTRKKTAADRAKHYHSRRAAIIAALGGKCKDCGTTEKLEIDGENGHPRQPRKLSRWTRVRMYETQLAAGELNCRCRRCNAKRGNRWSTPCAA